MRSFLIAVYWFPWVDVLLGVYSLVCIPWSACVTLRGMKGWKKLGETVGKKEGIAVGGVGAGYSDMAWGLVTG